MNHRLLPAVALVACLLLPGAVAPAWSQGKPPLDHSAYDLWRGIGDPRVSRDGAWVGYQITLQNGDPELVLRATSSETEYRLPRGGDVRFTASSGHAVALVAPARQETRQARLDEVKQADRPKPQLAVVALGDGGVRTWERVSSVLVPEEGGDWLAFLHEAEPEPESEAEPPAGETAAEESDEIEDRKPGTRLVLLNLATGGETSFEYVSDYAVAATGGALAYATATVDGSGDGVWWVDPASGVAQPVLEGRGDYHSVTVDRSGRQVAFLSNRDEFGADQPAFELWSAAAGAAATKAATAADLAAGWWVSEHRDPAFSDDGARLFFGSAPRPAVEPEEPPMLDEERVRVDIWHWQDPLLQPEQLLQADDERQRSYLAVAHLGAGTVVQLADEVLPEVEVLDDGDGAFGHGTSSLAYRMERSWDSPGRDDHYRVDIVSGARMLIVAGQRGPVEMSPDGRWFVRWNEEALAWMAQDLSAADAPEQNITAGLSVAVHNEDHDWAFAPQPYGVAGWLRAITAGAGRADELQLRYVDLDPESEWLEPETLLLSGLDKADKHSGFWRAASAGASPPAQLVREPRSFGRPNKAADADLLVYTREDVVEFPDLWVADTSFSAPRKISAVNPQQADYNWATAELTEWLSLDGEKLQGLIHKPEDFDPSRRYPMMVTFYERNSDGLYRHHAPTPHRSVIRQTFYASRGYIVFTPDITYEVGYPGESALEDVVSGVLHMIDQGYVDENNIGTQGHSWGGYQIAYMVTKTDIFKAAAGGAPVANMTSAYGGIRWGSGLSRMFQYEKTQSRLGATLWEAPLRYLENSPLFWADKVDTPLMMMHNDHDGAVPWYQGIEMFTALRRLGKPAWLINYNDEPHWPTTYANKVDWNIRMQQFFDHYLMGAPAPVWLAEGIPAVDKGRTLGLELQQ